MGLADDLKKLHDKCDIVVPEYEAVSSGILALDFATTVPGIPRGTIIDFYGKEGLGKTTTALTLVAERIKNGERCAYIDVEQRLNDQLINMNIPNRDLFEVFRPKDGDAALFLVTSLVQHPEIKMIVLDSVAALAFKEVMEDIEGEGVHVAIVSRKLSPFFQRVMTPIRENGCILVCINQLRTKPMQMTRGITETPTGGMAIRFYASFMMNMTPESFVRDGDNLAGHRVYITMDKNNFGPKGRKAYMTIMYGQGVDKVRDVIECGQQVGMIKKSSSWYYYKQGTPEEIKALGENQLVEKLSPILDKVQAEILAAWKNENPDDAPKDAPAIEEPVKPEDK